MKLGRKLGGVSMADLGGFMQGSRILATLTILAGFSLAGAVALGQSTDTTKEGAAVDRSRMVAATMGGEGLETLARDLNARERALEHREKTIAAREEDLNSAEKRLEDRLVEIQKMRDEIKLMYDGMDERRIDKVVALVEMVEVMRAKDAAAFVAALEKDLAVGVLDRMQARKAGQLLAALPPQVAAPLAERMTNPFEGI
jgi:flagellar motility protein MotE (MotC chaperone)